VDAGNQSNRAAHGIGGLLGHDGRPPAAFDAAGADELRRYPTVELRAGTVLRGERRGGSFLLELDDGSSQTARRVLLAAGMEYRRPALAGIDERWGGSVFHCPFCHGWEVRDEPLGVLDRGATGLHRALLLRAWSDDVTLLADGSAELDDDERAQLDAAGVTVDERPVAGLRGPGGTLTAVAFADGSERQCHGLLVPVTMHQRSALAEQLGADLAAPTPLAADAVAVDAVFATTVPGVFAAGDVSGRMPSVANAVAAGSSAAAAVVGSLVSEAHGLVPAGAGAGTGAVDPAQASGAGRGRRPRGPGPPARARTPPCRRTRARRPPCARAPRRR
jgi:thioredoxin reductase